MPFLPIFSFIYGLSVFLIIWPYLLAFILPSNSIIGPIPCQEKHPQIIKELLPICTVGLGAFDRMLLSSHAPHIHFATAVHFHKLAFIKKEHIHPVLNCEMLIFLGPLNLKTSIAQIDKWFLLC